VSVDALETDSESTLIWVPIGTATPQKLLVRTLGVFALHPTDDVIIVAGESLEQWRLSGEPKKEGSWNLRGLCAVAFSPDGSHLYALLPDRIMVIDLRDRATPVTLVTKIESEKGDEIRVTEQHIVLVKKNKVQTWSLGASSWDHEFTRDSDQQVVVVTPDRLATWGPAGLTFRDLGETQTAFAADQIGADCETDRSRRIRLLDVSVSLDGRRAALACGNKTAKVISTTDGTALAIAPLTEVMPWAIHLNTQGQVLHVYSTPTGSAASTARAEISSWDILNMSTDRIGGSGSAKWALAFALSNDGKLLGTLFAKDFRNVRLRVYSPDTGREVAAADSPVAGASFKIAIGPPWIATSSGEDVVIWKIDPPQIRREDSFQMAGEVKSLQFGGKDASSLAVVLGQETNARVVVFERLEKSWHARAPVRAGVWTMDGQPDPIDFSPVAVSGYGTLAYLTPGMPPDGARVTVLRDKGARLLLTHDSSVTTLLFASAETLLVATRSGQIWSWVLNGPVPVRKQIGQHESAVLGLVVGNNGRVLAVDRENLIRMWRLDAVSEEIGLRGLMEFPLNDFGISGLDLLGAKAIGFSGERLVTINQHARGLFADSWVIPSSEHLCAAAASRLGSLGLR